MDSKESNKTSISETQDPSSSCYSSMENPNSLYDVAQDLNQSHFESTILSFLSFPDSPSLSLSSSFDQVLHKFLSSSSSGDDDESVQDQLIDRTLHRVSLLLESTRRCSRKRLTLYNSVSWFLPPKLTIKVFSMLDTKSLMQVMTCCTMFNKCAMDPLCYSHIDLTTASEHVDDRVLRTMIHRAGGKIRCRSLKLGHVTNRVEYVTLLLTNYCLAPLLSADWILLTSIHLYNIRWLDYMSLCSVLSSCTNLTDLKIVGLNGSLELVLELLAVKCRLIETLFLENSSRGVIKDSTIDAFVNNCPNLTSLTLKDFNLSDTMSRILIKGFRKLKYMNLSTTFGIDGSFLRDLGHSCKDSPLETLILRDCCSLKEREVLEFLNSLIAGNFRFIRYIDVSRGDGLACDGDKRTSKPNFPLEKLKEERSGFTFVAEFPSTRPMLRRSLSVIN